MPYTIPVVMYLRPNGRRASGSIQVPAEYETPEKFAVLEAKLAELAAEGITVTTEDIPGDTASVCMDNGDFDYKTELFPLGEGLAGQITEFVMSFDVYDYRKAVELYDSGGDMFGEEEDLHEGHPIATEEHDNG